MKWVLDREDVIRLLGKALNRNIQEQDIHFDIRLEEGVFEVHLEGIELDQTIPEHPGSRPYRDTENTTTDVDGWVAQGPSDTVATFPTIREEDDDDDFSALHKVSEELVASVDNVSSNLDRPLGINESYDYPGTKK